MVPLAPLAASHSPAGFDAVDFGIRGIGSQECVQQVWSKVYAHHGLRRVAAAKKRQIEDFGISAWYTAWTGSGRQLSQARHREEASHVHARSDGAATQTVMPSSEMSTSSSASWPSDASWYFVNILGKMKSLTGMKAAMMNGNSRPALKTVSPR